MLIAAFAAATGQATGHAALHVRNGQLPNQRQLVAQPANGRVGSGVTLQQAQKAAQRCVAHKPMRTAQIGGQLTDDRLQFDERHIQHGRAAAHAVCNRRVRDGVLVRHRRLQSLRGLLDPSEVFALLAQLADGGQMR